MKLLLFYAGRTRREVLLMVLAAFSVVLPAMTRESGVHSFPDTRYFSESVESVLILWVQAVLLIVLTARVRALTRPEIMELAPPPRARLSSVLRATAGLVAGLFLLTLPVVILTIPGSPVVAVQLWLWRWLPDFVVLGVIVVWSASVAPGYLSPLAALLLWTAWLAGNPIAWEKIRTFQFSLFLFPPHRMFFTPSWEAGNALFRFSGEWLVAWLVFALGFALIPAAYAAARRRRLAAGFACGLLLIGAGYAGTRLMDPRYYALTHHYRLHPPLLEPLRWYQKKGRHFSQWKVEYGADEHKGGVTVRATIQQSTGEESPFLLILPGVAREIGVTGCEALSEFHYRCGGASGSDAAIVHYEIPPLAFMVNGGLPCGRLSLLYNLEGFSVPRIFEDETLPLTPSRPAESRWDVLEIRLPATLGPEHRFIGDQFRYTDEKQWICSRTQQMGNRTVCRYLYEDRYTVPVIQEAMYSLSVLPAHSRYVHKDKWRAVIGGWQETVSREGLTPKRVRFIETPYGVSAGYYSLTAEEIFFILDPDTLSRLNALAASALAFEFARGYMGNDEWPRLRVRTGARFEAVTQAYFAEVARRAGD